MKKIVTSLITLCFLLSVSVVQAWKGKKRYYPRANPYSAYPYSTPSYANPYGNSYAGMSAYAYGNPWSSNLSGGFPVMGGQSPWNQFGGSSFPMMNGFGSPMGMGPPFSAMAPMSMGSPFSAMSPMGMGSPMGMYSPLSPMSPTGFGSPFPRMSPFGSVMPYGSMPFNRFGRAKRSRAMPFF